MYQFINLPKKDELRIEGVDTDSHYRVQRDDGYLICEVEKNNDRQIASDIANAVRFARDAGYQQALSDIRNMLGVPRNKL